MYIPASFRVDEPETLQRFIEAYSFAALISTRDNAPFATHLPLLIDWDRRVLRGHFARSNPHSEAIGTEVDSLAIFSGPHAYISPSWYVTAPSVPTWNYTAVHVYGPLMPMSEDRTSDLLDAMVARYEAAMPEPWQNKLPQEFRSKMLAGVVGFEMPMVRIEGKFKLGQNRSEADQTEMLARLQSGGPAAQNLADFIVRHRG